MKKIYMKPEIFVAKVEMDVMLSAGSPLQVKIPNPNDENSKKADPTFGMETKERGDYGSDSNFGSLW